MPDKIKLILLGDVVAKIGRHAVKDALAKWQEEYAPDAVIANVENLAHGKGLTQKTLAELKEAGVSAFTGGNHAWKKHDPAQDEIRAVAPLALPANDPRTIPPLRYQAIDIKGEKLYLMNFLGQVYMHEDGVTNPFEAFDALYDELKKPKLVVIDLHAEITSEKVAFGHYVNGRASMQYGTHTHIPTADARILSEGTGFITDVGMTGSNDSVLGVDKQIIMRRFLGEKETFQYPETGPAWVNAIYCELDPNSGKCTMIKQVQEYLTIN